MPEPTEDPAAQTVQAVLCVDAQALDRFASVLRHLAVGLVDQAIQVRFVGSDVRVKSLGLGPIQALVEPSGGWFRSGRKTDRLFDQLSTQPPTVVHAMSHGSYAAAGAIAEEFDADLVLQVSSTTDCEAVAVAMRRTEAHVHAYTRPLVAALEGRFGVPGKNIERIPPGVPAGARTACFSRAGRTPAILCTSAFDEFGGVERLLDAIEPLVRRSIEFQAFLSGSGRGENALRRQVRAKGLSGAVTLTPPLEDLGGAMQGADVFVRPAREDAFCADTLQALAAGMVVVTEPHSVADFLVPNETALVVGTAPAGDLTQALETALRERSESQRIAANGLEHVRREHGISAMAERTAGSYRRLALARTTFTIGG